MLFTSELQATTDKDEHATSGARGLTINGGDVVLALLEWETGQLGDDVLTPLDLLTLEGQHGSVLVEARKPSTVRIEGGVVVLHECLCQRVWIHLCRA